MDSSVSLKDEIWFLRVSSHFKRSLVQGESMAEMSNVLQHEIKASCTGKGEGDAAAPLFFAKIQCPYCVMTHFIV
jgi:hypothetical protein